MGEQVNQETSQSDLLTVIGKAIRCLQKSIDNLEAQQQQQGLRHLSEVIEEIDGYLVQLDEDPLLQLAAVDPEHLKQSLHRVQDDLHVVIDSVQQTMT